MKRYNVINEESYEGMIFRLHQAYEYGRSYSDDDETWCLRDDPDYDDYEAA